MVEAEAVLAFLGKEAAEQRGLLEMVLVAALSRVVAVAAVAAVPVHMVAAVAAGLRVIQEMVAEAETTIPARESTLLAEGVVQVVEAVQV